MAPDCRACLAKAWHIVCLITVEPVMFLIALCDGITDTATQVLMYDKVCIMLLNDVDMCVARNVTSEEEIVVQQHASLWQFYWTLAANLPAFFLMIVYSNLVDRWSKKYTIIFAPVGYILCLIVYIVCSLEFESSPGYMLIGALALGFSGGTLSSMGACFSYLSATASPGMLIIHISMAEAALVGSSAISSTASGVLLEAVGYIWVYVIGIVINVVLILYVLFRIKDIPLSASVLAQSQVSVVSSTSVSSENPLQKAEATKRKVDDDELTIQMDVVPELEIAGQLSFYGVGDGLTLQEEIADGVDENEGNKKFHLQNGHMSQKNHVDEKFREAETAVGNDSLVTTVALSTFSNGVAIPSQKEQQLQQSLSSSSSLDTTSAKSTNCGIWSQCRMTAFTVAYYARMYVNTALKRRKHDKRKDVLAILFIILIECICLYAVAIGLCYLFVSQEPLSWSTAVYGYYTGSMKGVRGFCLLVILPLFKRLNVQYTTVMILSLVSSIISSTVFALSLYTWMAFLSVLLSLLRPALIVTARSSIVNFVDEDEHGKAFGMIASLETLAFLLSSVIFNIIIYPATVHIFSGLAILIAALTLLFPLALAIFLDDSKLRGMMRKVAYQYLETEEQRHF